GLDSSLVAAVAARASSRPITTFTVGFAERSHDEVRHARQVAQHIGSDHHEVVLQPDIEAAVDELPEQYDEPFGDASAIPTHLVSRVARSHVTVALAGDGGDELFGGYNWYDWVLKVHRANRALPMPSQLSHVGRALPAGTKGKRFLEALGNDAASVTVGRTFVFADEMRRRVLAESVVQAVVPPSPEDVVKLRLRTGATLLEGLTRTDFSLYLPDDILTKVDRASMSTSLEVRAPLLDQKVCELAFGLGDSFKVRGGVRKSLLRQYARSLLPPGLDLNRKQGFSLPLTAWFRGRLGDVFERRVVAGDWATLGVYLREDPVRLLFEQHRAGRYDHSYRLWCILAFAVWLEHAA
ncbi:MAG: asparagine synthase C-terminal domain-containing protein, partial [Armatimonadota bacterium]